jgi:hypothetical protein
MSNDTSVFPVGLLENAVTRPITWGAIWGCPNDHRVYQELARSKMPLDHRKMNIQLIANEEDQDRSQCGKNEASWMISLVCRA